MAESARLSCSILLLAGGRGSRVGEQDKGLLPWHGRPLTAWLYDTARPLTDDLIVSCNRNQDRYAIYADRLVADDEPDFPGPLAGIRAGLAVARYPTLLVVPCDSPLVDRALLQAIDRQARAHPGRPVMVRQAGHWQPLLCALPVHCRGAFDAAWRAGERSARRVMLQLDAVALELPPDDARTANLNTEQLLAAGMPLPAAAPGKKIYR